MSPVQDFTLSFQCRIVFLNNKHAGAGAAKFSVALFGDLTFSNKVRLCSTARRVSCKQTETLSTTNIAQKWKSQQHNRKLDFVEARNHHE